MRDEDGMTGPAFQLRTIASKNILDKMTQQDLQILNEAGERMANIGYPEHHKRRLVFRLQE